MRTHKSYQYGNRVNAKIQSHPNLNYSMALNRTFVHIDGLPGAGKTTLIERLLESNASTMLAAVRLTRVELDAAPVEEIREDNPEIDRYREAGASSAALLRYDPKKSHADDLWDSDILMIDYADHVLMEGPLPADFPPDLPVYVAPVLPEGQKLVRKATSPGSKNEAATSKLALRQEIMKQLLAPDGLHGPKKDEFDRMTRKLKRLDARWQIAEGYEGIEFAKVVAINVRSKQERQRAEEMADELREVRKNDELFEDLIGYHGDKRPITIRIADLSAPEDHGVKELVRRISRDLE